MHDPTRRDILAAGAAATALATTPALFAQQTGQGGTGACFYEKGSTRIRYAEAGSGFPLLVIPGGVDPHVHLQYPQGPHRVVSSDDRVLVRRAIPA